MEPFKLVKYALDSTVALVNKGSTPTQALEKVARDLDLNANYIQRTGETLNVALHHNHFVKSANRADDFPVADIIGVTKRIFGEKNASLEEKKAEWFPQQTVNIDYNKLLSDPKFKKTAAEIKSTKANFDKFETSLKGQFEKAANYITRIERELDAIKTEKVANDIYIEAAFNNLVSSFKKSAAARDAFHDFESNIYSEHGDKASPYVDLIYKAAQLKEERGARDSKALMRDSKFNQRKIFNSFFLAVSKSAELKSSLDDANEFVGLCKSRFKEAGHMLHKDFKHTEKAMCAQLADDLDDIGDVVVKEAGAISDSLVGGIIQKWRSMGEKSPDKLFKNKASDNHERVHMLQELIMTDPILAQQDPKKIIAAYQQLLRLAPHLAKEKEVVRSLLRQITATQALGPMEASQYIEANSNLLKQHKLWTSNTGDKDNK